MSDNMKQDVICEFCGSKDVVKQSSTRHFPIPFGETLEYIEDVIHCNYCGEEFSINNEVGLDQFLSKENPKFVCAINKSISMIVSELKTNGYNQARIERAFEIPRRSISRWVNENVFPSAGAVALLRLVKVFPWLIDCAEQNYNEYESEKIAVGFLCSQRFEGMYGDNTKYLAFQNSWSNDQYHAIDMAVRIIRTKCEDGFEKAEPIHDFNNDVFENEIYSLKASHVVVEV